MWLVGDTLDLAGAIDGSNRRFTARVPLRDDAVVYLNGLSRLPGPNTDNGYVLQGQTVVLGEAPMPGDVLAVYQPQASVTFVGGPTPAPGVVSGLSPSIGFQLLTPETSVWPPPSGSASIRP